jgi:hypothetical protein
MFQIIFGIIHPGFRIPSTQLRAGKPGMTERIIGLFSLALCHFAIAITDSVVK